MLILDNQKWYIHRSRRRQSTPDLEVPLLGNSQAGAQSWEPQHGLRAESKPFTISSVVCYVRTDMSSALEPSEISKTGHWPLVAGRCCGPRHSTTAAPHPQATARAQKTYPCQHLPAALKPPTVDQETLMWGWGRHKKLPCFFCMQRFCRALLLLAPCTAIRQPMHAHSA